MSPAAQVRLLPGSLFHLLCILLTAAVAGCSVFGSNVASPLSSEERPRLAILPFGMGVEITRLSSVQTVANPPPSEEEPQMVAATVAGIKDKARRLLYYQLEVAQKMTLIPLEEVDRAVEGMALNPEEPLTRDQIAALRTRLDCDLIVGGIVQDFGKVRWQWLAGGMLADMSWESVALGLATSWHPGAIFGNIGFELLTSTPVWFGGGYLFGVAFSPVRVDAWAQDGVTGGERWSDEAVTLLIWKRLEEVSEEDRKRKEVRLWLNLKEAMKDLGESLLDREFTKTVLQEKRRPRKPDAISFSLEY